MGKIPIVFGAPKVLPTANGNRLKKEPQPTPFMMVKNTSKPILVTNGQMAKALMPQKKSEMLRQFIGPRNESAEYPANTRPNVDARFQMVSAMMAVEPELPTDRAKMGIKYGGTKSGKDAMAPPRMRTMNLGSRHRYLVVVSE